MLAKASKHGGLAKRLSTGKQREVKASKNEGNSETKGRKENQLNILI